MFWAGSVFTNLEALSVFDFNFYHFQPVHQTEEFWLDTSVIYFSCYVFILQLAVITFLKNTYVKCNFS